MSKLSPPAVIGTPSVTAPVVVAAKTAVFRFALFQADIVPLPPDALLFHNALVH